MFSQIRKRDGRVVKFDPDKITNAIFKAGQHRWNTTREPRGASRSRCSRSTSSSWRPDSQRRRNPGHRRGDAAPVSIPQNGQGLHHLPRPARQAARHHQQDGGRPGGPVPFQGGLEGQREQQHGLLPPGAEQLHLLGGEQGLLAEQDLHPRDQEGAQRRRLPHPRPEPPVGLLRRVGPLRSPHRGLPGRHRQGREPPGKAPPQRPGAGRQLLLHPPGRGGRRAGLLELRHPAGALHPLRRAQLPGSQAGPAGVHLQHERPDAGGLPDALHERDPGPERAEALRRAERHHRRRAQEGDLRRVPGRDGPFQQGVPRGDGGGRCEGPRLHLPHPHLQHHEGLRLGQPPDGRPLGDDGQVRHALLLELRQLRHEPRGRPQHVLPAADRQPRAASSAAAASSAPTRSRAPSAS